MVKVNVAQYVIHDLLSRFPLNDNMVADDEIIDALIDGWAKNKYVMLEPEIKHHHVKNHDQQYLI